VNRKLIQHGLRFLTIIGFGTAAVDFIFFLNFAMPQRLPEMIVPRRYTPFEIALVGYFFSMFILNILIAKGLLSKWNKARITAIALSPAPLLGVLLSFTQAAYPTPIFLITTGISFPFLALLLQLLGLGAYIPPSALIILGLFNLTIPTYLTNKQVKNLFQTKQTPRETSKPPTRTQPW